MPKEVIRMHNIQITSSVSRLINFNRTTPGQPQEQFSSKVADAAAAAVKSAQCFSHKVEIKQNNTHQNSYG